MNYEDMSDRQVNELVAIATCQVSKIGLVTTKDRKIVNRSLITKNYCNNPSDAWSIIISTGMSVELAHKDLGGIGTCTIYNPMGTDWQCDFEDNDKALRAAVICFLKMKDAEK